jgi:hypothetical protein
MDSNSPASPPVQSYSLPVQLQLSCVPLPNLILSTLSPLGWFHHLLAASNKSYIMSPNSNKLSTSGHLIQDIYLLSDRTISAANYKYPNRVRNDGKRRDGVRRPLSISSYSFFLSHFPSCIYPHLIFCLYLTNPMSNSMPTVNDSIIRHWHWYSKHYPNPGNIPRVRSNAKNEKCAKTQESLRRSHWQPVGHN